MNVKDNKKDCSGCTACYSACPVKAITMQADEEGFLYPYINTERCIQCNICKSVCPFDNKYIDKIDSKNHKDFEQKYLAGKVKNYEILKRSRSGGLFYAIAEKILREGGVVYGVTLTDSLEAVFSRITRESELHTLQGSKYVQANKSDSFNSVKKDLEHSRIVFFAGVACEVAGLKSYLRQSKCDIRNLYTADLICHGVPSPRIWRDNLHELEGKWKMKIRDVDFRDKNLGWRSHIESYIGITKQGKMSKKKYSNKYTSLFYASVILRMSCHDCQFCNFNRPGDITLGDFWGVLMGENSKFAKHGISQMIVNSAKGQHLIENLACVDFLLASKEEISKQPNLFEPTPISENREKFWKQYFEYGYCKSSRKFYKFRERIKIPYNRIKNGGQK